MNQKVYRERECIHRKQGSEGEFYNGMTYVQAIQRLPSAEAVKLSRCVEAFYWSDAADIQIWLCRDCTKALRINENPRAVSSVQKVQHASSL